MPTNDGDRVTIGPFEVEFVPVTHSVPHAHAIVVRTEQGVILHSGDYKLDLTPVDDRRCDLARLGEIARSEGIRLLLADSTNAERLALPRAKPLSAACSARSSPSMKAGASSLRVCKSFASHPADCRCSHRRTSKSCDARPQHAQERSTRTRPWCHLNSRRVTH